MNKYKFGTREWATVNLNILNGCKNDCKYCYSKHNACYRWKRIKPENWPHPTLNKNNLNKKPKKVDGRIMFPTQHDLFPEFMGETIDYLRKWLEVGNDILIVSKPRFECIKRICKDLNDFKEQIVFRFTIGSKNDDVLRFWEPNAPDYSERVKSLTFAYHMGWNTSVSSEPYLDESIRYLVYDLLPYIRDTMWIGKMNFIEQRVKTDNWSKSDLEYLERVKTSQTDEFIKDLYDEFFGEKGVSKEAQSHIKWKESCKKVLGLEDEPIG